MNMKFNLFLVVLGHALIVKAYVYVSSKLPQIPWMMLIVLDRPCHSRNIWRP